MAKNWNENKAKSNKEKRKQLALAKQQKKETAYKAAQATFIPREARLQQALQIQRKFRKIEEVIETIWSNQESLLPHPRPVKTLCLQDIYQFCKNPWPVGSGGQPAFASLAKKFILHLENQGAKFLDHPDARRFQYALINLLRSQDKWLQSYESWKPSTKNVHRQFSDLVRYLLAKYPTPLFMDEVWFRQDGFSLKWWIHVAQGGNIRTAPDFPVELTKKMAHHMMQAPSSYRIVSAIRWGQLHALGGNERNVRGLLDNFLCTRDTIQKNQEDFWMSVFRWFIANPMLDPRHYSSICDYIQNQKYIIPLGAEAPPQPGFTMKDRNPHTLLNSVEEWHERLEREGRMLARQRRGRGHQSWDPHPTIKEFQIIHGPENNQTIYQIRQLLTSDQLFAEGSRLHHCVGSYAWSCTAGRVSIWSMRSLDHLQSSSHELMGTIEVENASKRVIQFKAKLNARPSAMAFKILNQWTGINKLNLSPWL